jgi:membrane-bound metal-dependent hydrolase YbcI (DUF457 family)
MTSIVSLLFVILFAALAILYIYKRKYIRAAVYISAIALVVGIVIDSVIIRGIFGNLAMFFILIGIAIRTRNKFLSKMSKRKIAQKYAAKTKRAASRV